MRIEINVMPPEKPLGEIDSIFITEAKSYLEQAVLKRSSLSEIEKNLRHLRYSFMMNLKEFNAFMWYITKDEQNKLCVYYGRKKSKLILEIIDANVEA